MGKFINILREQDFGSHVGHMEVTLPNGHIELYGPPGAEGLDYTVPTVVGDLTIKTVPADTPNALTHTNFKSVILVLLSPLISLIPIWRIMGLSMTIPPRL